MKVKWTRLRAQQAQKEQQKRQEFGHHLRQAAGRAKEIWFAQTPRKGGDGNVSAVHQEDPHPVYGHVDLYAKGAQTLDPSLTPQIIPVLPGNPTDLESVLRSGTEGQDCVEIQSHNTPARGLDYVAVNKAIWADGWSVECSPSRISRIQSGQHILTVKFQLHPN